MSDKSGRRQGHAGECRHPWRWWPAFAVIPHWNWRGEADYGTLGGLGANNGGAYTCWSGETNRCIGPPWRPRLFSIAQQRPDTAVFQWYGTLLSGKEDGAGLQYHRNRYVDPATGRFTQEDPIGLAGGINVYGFANGDPVTYGDPFGAQGACKEKTAKCTHERIQQKLAQAAMRKFAVQHSQGLKYSVAGTMVGLSPAIGALSASGATGTSALAGGLVGTGVRYMGPLEAQTVQETGVIPATYASGEARAIHFTADAPMASAADAMATYGLDAMPTHMVTFPLSNLGNLVRPLGAVAADATQAATTLPIRVPGVPLPFGP